MIADVIPRMSPTAVVRVLMVEDNAADARLVTEFLLESEPRRFAVTNVRLLREARETLRSDGFDVIILDLGLPDSEGLDTLRQIRAEAARTPIIVLTGLDDESTGIEAVNSGAQDYLVKGAATGYLLRHSVVYAIERAKVEATIRERDERFRQLADNMREVFFVVDAFFRETLYVSPGYEQVWGTPCQALYDRPAGFLDSVLPEDVDIVRENIAHVQNGEDAGEIEFRITRPDGERRWILTHAMPVRDANGNVYRIAGVAMDVTDRRRATEALQESETRYRLLSETSFDGIVISENGIILEANTGFARIHRRDLETLIGQPIVDLVVDESRDEVRGRLLQREPGRYEFTSTRSDGKKLRLEATFDTFTIGGRTKRITAVRDLTDKHALERQYLQAQKMEAIGRLAGGVAHDFNNLLTVISSYASLVIDEETLTDAIRDDISQIEKASAAAATLTRQLLAFSRQQVTLPVSLDLNDVVRDAQKILRRVIGEDVSLVAKLDENLGRALADFGQIEQVIMNLAVNARDAMPRGGKLTIETSNAVLAESCKRDGFAASAGPYVVLAIGDTGTGMDDETKLRIFEPFFTTKESGKGTGLGLSMVFGIVQQSGGYVDVESAIGHGATFRIYLPRVDAPAEAPSPVAVGESARGTETVLLVEDVSALREIVRRVLVEKGYTVLDAVDGPAALLLAEKFKNSIHLLITDVVLPGMSGHELARALQPARPGLKVLFTSGYTDDAVLRRGVFERDVAFLQKPFTPEVLTRRVRDVLDGIWGDR